jgi:hypothetical protein
MTWIYVRVFVSEDVHVYGLMSGLIITCVDVLFDLKVAGYVCLRS